MVYTHLSFFNFANARLDADHYDPKNERKSNKVWTNYRIKIKMEIFKIKQESLNIIL